MIVPAKDAADGLPAGLSALRHQDGMLFGRDYEIPGRIRLLHSLRA